MESRQVRLSHQELGQLRSHTAVVMALVAFWTVTAIDLGQMWIVLPAILCQFAMLVAPRWPSYIPPRFWNGLTPTLILFIIADFILARPDLLSPLARMIALLALWRTIAPRQAREDQQLVLLCLIMVILTGVMTLSLLFAFQLMIFTPLAMGLLFLVNLQTCGGQEQLPLKALWAGFRWGSFIRRMRAAVDYRLMGYGGVLFAALLAMTLGIFFAMPRFDLQRALPFLQMGSEQSLSGFSDEITYGDVVDIMEDERIALRVDVNTEEELPAAPYWRMVALDEYTGQGFRMSESAKESVDRMNTHQFGRVNVNSEAPAWTFYFEGSISRYLPTIGLFDDVRFQNRTKFEFNPDLWVFALEKTPAKVIFYQSTGAMDEAILPANLSMERIDLAASATEPEEGPSYPLTTLDLPIDSESRAQLDAFVAEIRARPNTGDVAGFTVAATDWLQERHDYSLQTRIPGGSGDALVRWMDSRADGHCELYAGALTLLLRAEGYPARVVTGFKGGSWNGYENYYMVRNRNAHAWVEVFDPQAGWLRTDPTPGLGDGALVAAGLTGFLAIDRTLGAYLDSLRVLWYRRIVNFDQSQQQAIANSVKEEALQWLEDLKAPFLAAWESLQALWQGEWQMGDWLYLARMLLLALAIWLLLRLSLRHFLQWLSQRKGSLGEAARNPIRHKAGRWLHDLQADPALAQLSGYGDVLLELRQLRYDQADNWPDTRAVFKRALELRKEARKRR